MDYKKESPTLEHKRRGSDFMSLGYKAMQLVGSQSTFRRRLPFLSSGLNDKQRKIDLNLFPEDGNDVPS
jgi:hypothetical protein